MSLARTRPMEFIGLTEGFVKHGGRFAFKRMRFETRLKRGLLVGVINHLYAKNSTGSKMEGAKLYAIFREIVRTQRLLASLFEAKAGPHKAAWPT